MSIDSNFVQVENAKKIAASAGLRNLETVLNLKKSITVRGTGSCVRVREQLQSQIGFKPRNESVECADCAQHVWHRPGLGRVTIQGSLYSGRDNSAKVAVIFNSI